MIICNLSIILAEQSMSITDLSKLTNISRTTLTALASNSMKGFQLDTIDTICKALRINIEELFIYRPFSITIRKEEIKNGYFKFHLEFDSAYGYHCPVFSIDLEEEGLKSETIIHWETYWTYSNYHKIPKLYFPKLNEQLLKLLSESNLDTSKIKRFVWPEQEGDVNR